MATKKVTKRYLKTSEYDSISKNLVSAIRACTKIIDNKDTLLLADGSSAKTDIRSVRSILQKANDKLSASVGWKLSVGYYAGKK